MTGVFDGFGGVTQGGKGQPTYHVTNLNDTGSGSFRDAVSAGNRYIAFDVAGRITNRSIVDVRGDYITVDGATSPGGITFDGRSIRVTGPGHHDIVLSQFRNRGGPLNVVGDGDNLTLIRPTSYNIVFDHLSLSGNHDEAIGLWDSIHDVSDARLHHRLGRSIGPQLRPAGRRRIGHQGGLQAGQCLPQPVHRLRVPQPGDRLGRHRGNRRP